MDVTPERAAQVDFSDIYYENSAVFVAKKETFKGPDDLVDKTVGVQNGTSPVPSGGQLGEQGSADRALRQLPERLPRHDEWPH